MSEESKGPTSTEERTTGPGHGKLLLAGLVGSVVGAVGARAQKEALARQDQRRLRRHLRPRVNGEVVMCRR